MRGRCTSTAAFFVFSMLHPGSYGVDARGDVGAPLWLGPLGVVGRLDRWGEGCVAVDAREGKGGGRLKHPSRSRKLRSFLDN